MKQIVLTQGQVTLVDDADYEYLNQFKWHVHKQRSGNFYAARKPPLKNKERTRIYMHREILGLEHEDKRQSDHKNHNTLDNQRVNIRICTNQQNQRNQKLHSNTSSQFKGVSWHKQAKKWVAHITINGEIKHLGYWNMEEVAALRYDMVAIREFGEYAHLNFN